MDRVDRLGWDRNGAAGLHMLGWDRKASTVEDVVVAGEGVGLVVAAGGAQPEP